MVSKKVAVIFLVIALVLAISSITYAVVNSSKTVPSLDSGSVVAGQAGVGITINPQAVEDRGVNGS